MYQLLPFHCHKTRCRIRCCRERAAIDRIMRAFWRCQSVLKDVLAPPKELAASDAEYLAALAAADRLSFENFSARP